MHVQYSRCHARMHYHTWHTPCCALCTCSVLHVSCIRDTEDSHVRWCMCMHVPAIPRTLHLMVLPIIKLNYDTFNTLHPLHVVEYSNWGCHTNNAWNSVDEQCRRTVHGTVQTNSAWNSASNARIRSSTVYGWCNPSGFHLHRDTLLYGHAL